MSKQQGLILSGNSKLGKALVAEALKANQERLQKRVVGNVQELMVQIERQRKQVENHQAAIKIMERRVVALRAGKFTMSDEGTITFTESELGKEVCHVSTCNQCGYPKTVIARF
jgi:hypothetical protein